ncbi:PIG-L family deacetylase [Nocardioides mangrovicus]|uniref:PIG-L family deacetylase n=1 Tax=Nocardioides mangrovicus TaxID=2478913 RepID=A0A3L8P1X8_9ACTN|nr:PIG-L family deacetylase [Nocardioides mangrovicus]RLV48619.1 PIG-L family deacetylase [Nocardioides mangrovicus]
MRLRLDGVRELALVGAHCDDIAIGCGATVLRLAAANPGLVVRALVLSGGGTAREQEEHDALATMLPDADVRLSVLDLPDGRLPDHRDRVKDALQRLAAIGSTDLVLSPQRHDAHQDHRLLGELVPTAFRSALHLGYEILKWESDLPVTTVLVPADEDVVATKVAVIEKSYPSQSAHDWFDEEAFRALMRVRGAQCHERYAEGFVTDKTVLTLS